MIGSIDETRSRAVDLGSAFRRLKNARVRRLVVCCARLRGVRIESSERRSVPLFTITSRRHEEIAITNKSNAQTTPRRRHRRREEERKRRSTFLLPCRARNPRSQYSSRVLCEISFFMERKSVNSCAGGLENAVSLQSSGERKPYVFFSAKYVAFTKLPRVLVEPVVEV